MDSTAYGPVPGIRTTELDAQHQERKVRFENSLKAFCRKYEPATAQAIELEAALLHAPQISHARRYSVAVLYGLRQPFEAGIAAQALEPFRNMVARAHLAAEHWKRGDRRWLSVRDVDEPPAWNALTRAEKNNLRQHIRSAENNLHVAAHGRGRPPPAPPIVSLITTFGKAIQAAKGNRDLSYSNRGGEHESADSPLLEAALLFHLPGHLSSKGHKLTSRQLRLPGRRRLLEIANAR